MAEELPVLVVGAGPTGMTAAMELARAGVPVRIVDRAVEPSATSRALAVQARTMELLDQRGVGPRMTALGNRAHATTLYGRGRRLAAVRLEKIPSRHNHVLLLAQSETERLLREELARLGVTVERGVTLTAFAQQRPERGRALGDVRAVLRRPGGDTEEVGAAAMISAEGAHSSIRHTLGLPFEGTSSPRRYALADLRLDGGLPDDELSVFLATDGFLAVFPMGDRRFRFIATTGADEGLPTAAGPRHPAREREPGPDGGHGQDEDRGPGSGRGPDGEPALEELQSLYDHLAHIPARLHGLTWSSRFRVNSRHLKTLRVGSVFFGGDSAHVHSPAGGQGMNTGIQDMINLCWKLALVLRGKAVPALLDTYQQERLPLIESLVRTTEKATDAFNSESPWAHWLLTRVVPLALDLDAVQHRGTRILSELSADYRRSPLSSAAPGHAGLRPGDRAPDLSVRTLTAPAPGTAGVHAPVHPPASGRPAAVGASGTEAGGSTERPSRLYELLDPDRPTLVAVAPEHGGPATAEGAAGRLEPWRGLLSFRRIAVGPRQLPGLDVDATARELRSRGGLLLVRPDAYLAAVAPLDDPAALRSWLGRWLTPAHAVAERPATV